MDKFLKLCEVEAVTSLKKSKIYDMIGDGAFPPPVKVTSHRSAWPASEIISWMEDLKARRDENVIGSSASVGE